MLVCMDVYGLNEDVPRGFFVFAGLYLGGGTAR